MRAFDLVVAAVAFLAGATSAVAGFGIGTILTPLLGFGIGVRLAVAAASIPHFVGNAARLWTLRRSVDRDVLKSFGLMSAAGALAGALLHAVASIPTLKFGMAALLILAGGLGVAGYSDRVRMGRRGAWFGGALSGFLGGFVGNQGGIRAAAMLALDVRKEVFVASAVAIALVVDGARLPVYAVTVGRELLGAWRVVAIAGAGVLAGTLLGKSIFGWIP
ncbi:MAG TPA: sulfite exporter TauE/SafE family protein, partial [Thermoanaerobaculia bacterium]|nr:sulfite exporter TauE/SafE family protein [Thermoanaerobaculia bacterium]